MNRSIDLSIASYTDVKSNNYHLAILPWGATEPHNMHLPYLTDAILSHDISVDAAALALKSGIKCMVLPPVTYGSQNPGQRELKFCIHARYETQKAILKDIVASLHAQGLDKLVIINGHGGNNFKNMIRDLAIDYPDFLIASTEWYGIIPHKEYFESPGDHADEVETSVMLHYHPELVDMSTAGSGASLPFAIESLNNKTAWIPRNWSRVSIDTGIGDPGKATSKKGTDYVEAVIDRLSVLFTDLATGEIYIK